MQAAAALGRTPAGELGPHLPAFLNALLHEQEQPLISQLANVIQRAGPEQIPAVTAAIDRAQSDLARRELLRALSQMGNEGQKTFANLMQSTPEYRQLYSDRLPEGPKPPSNSPRGPPPLEQKAPAKQSQINPMIEYRYNILRGGPPREEARGQNGKRQLESAR